MVDQLSSSKVSAETSHLEISDLEPIRETDLQMVEKELRDVVLGYNFDSFSFLFELLDLADQRGISVADAFNIFQINSLELLAKYKGSNCAGLSLNLQAKLISRDIKTEIAPSYGHYLAIKEADEYAQIRTVDVVGVLKQEENDIWIFLAPGLTIEKPILVVEGFVTESFGRRYEVNGVTNTGFTFISIKPDGERLERFFGFERFTNPDLSSQKNLLRCRIKYQITKQLDTHREQITFNLATQKFKVKMQNIDLIFTADEFMYYLRLNASDLITRFNNPYLTRGFQLMVKYMGEIRTNLLIPGLQNYIQEQ